MRRHWEERERRGRERASERLHASEKRDRGHRCLLCVFLAGSERECLVFCLKAQELQRAVGEACTRMERLPGIEGADFNGDGESVSLARHGQTMDTVFLLPTPPCWFGEGGCVEVWVGVEGFSSISTPLLN